MTSRVGSGCPKAEGTTSRGFDHLLGESRRCGTVGVRLENPVYILLAAHRNVLILHSTNVLMASDFEFTDKTQLTLQAAIQLAKDNYHSQGT